MQISFDPVNITNEEREILLAVLDVTPAAAPKAAPAAKPAAKKPEPVAEEPEEDLLGGEEEAAGEVTMEDAVAAATKLVSDGKAADVKKALAAVGAKRVSEVAEADLAKFVASIS